ncbi:MAG: hypothetical protein JWL99_5620 [Streptomyces oryziradicis]|jgi:hypothetical protein|nr:hypothetical protein [Actinacidiphila oryziradicis]MDX6329597.1 hypothetical protein [Streptomycetaceae bacterium]
MASAKASTAAVHNLPIPGMSAVVLPHALGLPQGPPDGVERR